MALKVNKILREEAEKEQKDVSISVYDYLTSYYNYVNADQLPYLGNDKERMDTFLDRMCKQFGNFSDDPMTRNKIEQELSEEVNDLDKKCLRNESCWSIVEKGARSIAALISLGQHPNAGSYLSHHMSRMLSSEYYLLPKKPWKMHFIRSTEFDEN